MYRRLSNEELKELEKEFIVFLAAQSITAEDWEKIKSTQVERSEELIMQFSNMIYETVLKSITLLERRKSNEIRFLEFGETEVNMIALILEGDLNEPLNESSDPQKLIQKFEQNGGKMRVEYGSKDYAESKEKEIFNNLERAYLISKNVDLHNSLKNLISNQKNISDN